jgi:hypothetical protein
MSKLLYTLVSVAICSAPVWAGPSTPAMATGPVSAAPHAEIAVSTAVTTDTPAESASDDRSASFADTADLAPTDSHPMIPLPPAVWAGFVGLAYVARRVTRRQPI